VPSQKGFFVEAPQRQSTVLVSVGRTFPLVSRNSIEPLMIYGPFGLTSIVASATRILLHLAAGGPSWRPPSTDHGPRGKLSGFGLIGGREFQHLTGVAGIGHYGRELPETSRS
jgi:hypothetical protein